MAAGPLGQHPFPPSVGSSTPAQPLSQQPGWAPSHPGYPGWRLGQPPWGLPLFLSPPLPLTSLVHSLAQGDHGHKGCWEAQSCAGSGFGAHWSPWSGTSLQHPLSGLIPGGLQLTFVTYKLLDLGVSPVVRAMRVRNRQSCPDVRTGPLMWVLVPQVGRDVGLCIAFSYVA